MGVEEVIEAAVPTEGVTTVNGQIVVGSVAAEKTGVSERLAIVHGVSVRVEEVARRGNHFVSDRRVEMTDVYRQIIVSNSTVQLRNR